MKKLILSLIVMVCLEAMGLAQQPSTSQAPLYSTNSKWVQGVGPGYWPTSNSGFILHLSPGSIVCNGTSPVTYAGGTITLTANTTNYIQLNSAASCVPSTSTLGFTSGNSPIAIVITNGSHITSITDWRPMGVGSGGAGSSGNISVGFTGDGTVYNISVPGSPVTAPSGTFAPTLKAQLSNTVLAGPRVAVPGAAAVVQISF